MAKKPTYEELEQKVMELNKRLQGTDFQVVQGEHISDGKKAEETDDSNQQMRYQVQKKTEDLEEEI